jgi:hypothetical protein
MIYVRYPDAFGEIPLLIAVDDNRPAIFCPDQCCNFFGLHFLAAEDNFAVEFQISNIVPFEGIDVIEICGMGKPTVESKNAINIMADDPLDQITEQFIVVVEPHTLFLALFTFDKLAKLKRIMRLVLKAG